MDINFLEAMEYVGLPVVLFENFSTPAKAMAWAKAKGLPNVEDIGSALSRGEQYTAIVPFYDDLKIVISLNGANDGGA